MNANIRLRYWMEGRTDTIVDMVGAQLTRARAEDIAKTLNIPASELLAAAKRRGERLRRHSGGPLVVRTKPALVPEGQKWCPRCLQFRSFEDFGPGTDADGKRGYCRPCWNNYQNALRRRRKKKAA